MAGKKTKFDVPKDIRALADKFGKERAKKERSEKLLEQKEEKSEKRRCAKRSKDGLSYAEKIMEWARAFKESAAGQELMKQDHLLTAHGRIIFFDGKIKGVDWIGLAITHDGIYFCGEWFMAYLEGRTVSSPEELAGSMDPRILKAVCEWIDSGKVWRCIKRQIGYIEESEKRLGNL